MLHVRDEQPVWQKIYEDAFIDQTHAEMEDNARCFAWHLGVTVIHYATRPLYHYKRAFHEAVEYTKSPMGYYNIDDIQGSAKALLELYIAILEEAYDYMFTDEHEGKKVRSKASYIIEATYRTAKVVLKRSVVCRLKGHQWVDDSVAGPDTGEIYMHCKRCGITHHRILYQ